MEILRARLLAVPVALSLCATAPGGGIAGAEEAAVISAAATGALRVYACPGADVPTYADRPCAPAAAVLEIPASIAAGTPAAVPASSSSRSVGLAGTRASAAGRADPSRARGERASGVPGAPAAESARCRSVRTSLERLDSRMRAGYAPAAGERLRARRRELRAIQHAERCRPSTGPP